MRRLLKFLRIHPPMEDLVEWADGTPRPGTGRHLRFCAACRAHVALIRNASLKARANEIASGEVSALALAFERLQIRMRAHAYSPERARLTETVELYFGREAANRLVKGTGSGDAERHLVLAMKPMFSAFLGAVAADALAERIAGAEC